VLAATLLCASSAFARSPPADEPSPADKETARELFQTGNERFEAADYRGALEAYEGADAIMRVPTTAYKLARTLAKLGRLTEARDAALRAHRYREQADEPEAYRTARQDAERLSADLRERIPSLTVKVSGVKDPATLYVSIDGATLAWKSQHLPRRLDPGKHVVRATARGYRAKEMRVTLREREHLRVSIALAAEHDEAASAVEVHPLTWVGFGFAVVGIAVGSVTGVVSLNAAAAAKDQCYPDDTCPKSAADDLDRAALSAHFSTASFIIGGVGLAVGVGALVWSFSNNDDKRAIELTPFGVRGRF
jgi:hypothetical protein